MRTIRRHPGYAIAAVAILAPAIAAGTGVFAFVDAILLGPLPYTEPERVVMVWETRRDAPARDSRSAAWADPRQSHVSAANLTNWRALGLFERIEPVAYGWFGVAGEQTLGGRAGPGFFEMLGVKAALGRAFTEADAGQPVAVLSHRLWRSRFGGEPSIVGRAISLGDGPPHTVIGVLGPEFFFQLNDFQLWTPFTPSGRQAADRSARTLLAAARLAHGKDAAQTQAELTTAAAHAAAIHPQMNRGWTATIVPVSAQFRGFVGPILLTLFGAVSALFLIAAAHLAILALARAEARRKEIAIRMALGATRGRIARMLGGESLLVGLAGGVCGLAIAMAALQPMIALLPVKLPIPIPGLDQVAIAGRATLLALTAAAAAAMVMTALALARAGGKDLRPGRSFQALAAVQAALTLVLLSAAGVAGKSMWNLLSADQGFEKEGVLTFRTPLARRQRPDSREWPRVFSRYLEAVERAPGVESAAVAYNVPLGGGSPGRVFQAEGESTQMTANTNSVGARYFETLRIPLISGRDFNAADSDASPAVAIVSESLARRLWPGRDAVGRRVRAGDGVWITVAGVVGDVRPWANASPQPLLYRPYTQAPASVTGYVARMKPADPEALRRAIRAVDPEQGVTFLRPIEDDFIDQIYPQRASAFGLFPLAALALGLAIAGVFSTTAFFVERRRREMGIRAAVGASPRHIFDALLRPLLQALGAGAAVGVAASVVLNRLLTGSLYGVEPADLTVLAGAAGLFAAAALSAAVAGTANAVRADPATELRQN